MSKIFPTSILFIIIIGQSGKIRTKKSRHLKPIRLWWLIYARLGNKWTAISLPKNIPSSSPVEMNPFIPALPSYSGDNVFSFLNRIHAFSDIDWNFNEFGKLWTYHLNCFEYLNQQKISKVEGLRLIRDFISKRETHKVGCKHYPVALRMVNWVKFMSRFNIHDEAIDRQLYSDCIRISKTSKGHLPAYYLLEIGFGLLFCAYYFREDRLYRLAEKMICEELEEQILSDGAHYALSPTYHQIILSRVLDSYNLVRSNDWGDRGKISEILDGKAQKMLSWLENMTFKLGICPMVSDASQGVAPETKMLVIYAELLDIKWEKIPLGESGYRMFKNGRFELLCDLGQTAPIDHPGYCHADNLNFILHIDGIPCIVDTGISSCEKNERRKQECSMEAHNTLVVNNKKSSQASGGYRMGKRARTTILEEKEMEVTAQHDGYSHLGVIHRRTFKLTDTQVIITDRIIGQYAGKDIRGYLHFHPDASCVLVDDQWLINGQYLLEVGPDTELDFEYYQFSLGYNRLKRAKRLVYKMKGEVATMRISLNPVYQIDNNKVISPYFLIHSMN